MASATQALMTSAASTEASNNATYKMAIYTFNGLGPQRDLPVGARQPALGNLSAAQAAAGNINVLEVYTTTTSAKPIRTTTPTPISKPPWRRSIPSCRRRDRRGGSTPQEVLFIVSDGVDDEVSTSCSQTLDGSRCQQPFNTTWCTTVKNRGIFIAVLYTVYLPLPTNSWYNQWIAPFQSQISSNMESCASPGLFFSVTTDGDIAAAMQALFQQAIQMARLTQ